MERSENTKSQIPNLGHVDQIWDDPIWDLVIRGPKIPNPKTVQPPAPVVDSGMSCSERFPLGKMTQRLGKRAIIGPSYPKYKNICLFTVPGGVILCHFYYTKLPVFSEKVFDRHVGLSIFN